jgi:hypothetical protein
MKTKYLLPILFLTFIQNIFSQVTFFKTFTDVPIDFYIAATDVKQTADSGYIVTGLNAQPSYGAYLMKFNSNGDTVWTKHYDNSAGVAGTSVIQTCDGGYVSAGSQGTSGSGIIKTNSTGETSWIKSYPEMFGGRCYLTSDCGYIMLGATNSAGAGDYDIYVI